MSYQYGAERQQCERCSNLTLRVRVALGGAVRSPECFDCSLARLEETNRGLEEAITAVRQIAEETRDRLNGKP